MEKERINIQEIENMDEAAWQAYRQQSWTKKGQQYTNDAPEWYLKNKNSFADFIEIQNKRRLSRGQAISEKNSPNDIRNMSEEEWQSHRKQLWENKKVYYSQPLPEWYLKDKAQYINFIKRSSFKK
jgi:hypothetical protein